METPRLFGANYSVYVRIARLVLAEKKIEYDLVPVDIFAEDGAPGWYPTLHPFGKIPSFQHGALTLFETSAITRYIDEAFEGTPLQPREPVARAVMNQIIGLLDAYAYRTLVWDVYVERCERNPSNEERIAAALPQARLVLETLSRLKRNGPWLLGNQLTLADLHAAPMLEYFERAPEGRVLLEKMPLLGEWWAQLKERSSFRSLTS